MSFKNQFKTKITKTYFYDWEGDAQFPGISAGPKKSGKLHFLSYFHPLLVGKDSSAAAKVTF
jgi:hypothetical protein